VVELQALPELFDGLGQLRHALMPSQWLMIIALPLTLTLAGAEWWHFRRSDKYDWRDSLTSTIMGGSYVLLAEDADRA
jgi:hypothetical protein